MKTIASFLLVTALAAHAALADDADPPDRVARISYVQGNANLQADQNTAETAEVNRPVTIGDRLRTEDQALLELSLGTSAIRLDEKTDLSIANLDDDVTQLQLDSGVVSLHVLQVERGETIEIDTPTATVRVLEPGDYRIESWNDGSTVVQVRRGDAELDGGGGPVRIRDQQQILFAGPDHQADVRSLGAPDDFDQWSMSRDRRFEDSRSAQYVSRDVVGYEDLDDNGTWDSDPDYGQVWVPTRVVAGWAPYRYGNWVWVQPWGWSWVDDAPWGFAPSHYGRWAYARNRWCWVPGPRNVRPVYAPALVAWDRGPGVSVGFTITNRPARWFPLGPREVYVPGHRVSPRYLQRVNVSNTTIVSNTYITNVYQNRVRDVRYLNRGAPNALTTRETLPRVARPQPAPHSLPPRPVFARQTLQREGQPIARLDPRERQMIRQPAGGADVGRQLEQRQQALQRQQGEQQPNAQRAQEERRQQMEQRQQGEQRQQIEQRAQNEREARDAEQRAAFDRRQQGIGRDIRVAPASQAQQNRERAEAQRNDANQAQRQAEAQQRQQTLRQEQIDRQNAAQHDQQQQRTEQSRRQSESVRDQQQRQQQAERQQAQSRQEQAQRQQAQRAEQADRQDRQRAAQDRDSARTRQDPGDRPDRRNQLR